MTLVLAFLKISPKIKLFLKKNVKISSAGGYAPRPPCLRRLGALPQNPHNTPPNCGFLPTRLPHCNVYNYMGFCSFCFEQFFLDRSVANLMLLTIDVR